MYYKLMPPEGRTSWADAAHGSGKRLKRLLSEAREEVLPARCNRMAIFNSRMVHRRDAFEFSQGYEAPGCVTLRWLVLTWCVPVPVSVPVLRRFTNARVSLTFSFDDFEP